MFVIFVVSNLSHADLKLNQTPPVVQLAGSQGGRLDGTSWNSSELRGAVYILMYVDPDKVKLNEHVEDALTNQQYPPD